VRPAFVYAVTTTCPFLVYAAIVVVAFGLAGCQPGKPELAAPAPVIRRVEVLGVRVPQRLRHCRAEPEILGESATQGDIAPAYVDALAAGQDCRRRLGAVDAILSAAEARAKRGAR
jgi:hypothetical protein